VPRFLRLPVLASAFLEYKRYSPVLSFRIMTEAEQLGCLAFGNALLGKLVT
jgi:hypothetical protein